MVLFAKEKMDSLKPIYEKFKNEINAIGRYQNLSSYSYDISRMQYYKNANRYKNYIDTSVDGRDLPLDDDSAVEISEKCMWISIEEYANKEQCTVDEIEMRKYHC